MEAVVVPYGHGDAEALEREKNFVYISSSCYRDS